MKRKISFRILIMSIMFLLIMPGQEVLGDSIKFDFNKNLVNTTVNQVFSLDLKGKDIKDMYGFEIALSFDPDQIEWVEKPSVTFTEGFSAGPVRALDNKVYFGFTKIGPKSGESGDIKLGEFKFKAKIPGTHTMTLESIKVIDSKMKAKDYKVRQVITVKSKGNKADLLKDIKGHWAEDYIRKVVDLGYMIGKSEDQFKPNDYLTRGEMATVLSRLVESLDQGTASFLDIQGDEWYAGNILAMANQNLIRGYEDGNFRPKANITRAETVTILARMEKEKGTYVTPETVDSILEGYQDKAPVWAKEEVAWAIEKGLIQGDTSHRLNMEKNITRAETAVILCRTLGLE